MGDKILGENKKQSEQALLVDVPVYDNIIPTDEAVGRVWRMMPNRPVVEIMDCRREPIDG